MNAQNQHSISNGNSTTTRPPDLPNRVKPVWRIVLCLLTLVASLHFSHGATYVGGPQTGNWTSNNSPYLVTNDVSIYALTIQPGVEVRFQGPYAFDVVTSLQAQGTSNAPIVFTNETGAAGWKGIYFNNSVASWLNYCQVYGSSNSGVRIANCSPTLINSVIARNYSPSSGGGVSVNGGNVLIDHCIISNNLGSSGGGLLLGAGNIRVYNTVVKKNSANPPGISGSGGGVYLTGGSATFQNCLVISNSAGVWGSGMYRSGGTQVSLINCTVVGNSGSEGIANTSGYLAVTNSVIWFNSVYGNFIFDHCDVQGVPGTNNNMSVNPGLCMDNFSLGTGSLCIDAGNPDPAFYDKCTRGDLCSPFPRGTFLNDMGAYGGPYVACGYCLDIVSQPQPVSSCLGGSATFAVSATGDPPLAYQWFFGVTPLTGRTDAQLTLTNLLGTDAGLYWVLVTNACGSLSSDLAQLVVNDACLDICMIAGLTISGQSGSKYVLKYTTDMANTNFASWTALATNTMGSGPWLYSDWGSCGSPKRFYGARLSP